MGKKVPEWNIKTYEILFLLENLFRELIIHDLSNIEGDLWWKKRLPGEILEKYREGIETQKRDRSGRNRIFHPIYFIDFAHIKIVIVRKDNWSDSFSKYFVKKEKIQEQFQSIEPIRNNIAHNRIVIKEEYNLIKKAYDDFQFSIGFNLSSTLINKFTIDENIPNNILKIHDTLCNIQEEILNYKNLDDEYLEKITNTWWFDNEILGINTNKIQELSFHLSRYKNLVQQRGSGYLIESFIVDNNISQKINLIKEECIRELKAWGKL